MLNSSTRTSHCTLWD